MYKFIEMLGFVFAVVFLTLIRLFRLLRTLLYAALLVLLTVSLLPPLLLLYVANQLMSFWFKTNTTIEKDTV